jgi:hypothetical protein
VAWEEAVGGQFFLVGVPPVQKPLRGRYRLVVYYARENWPVGRRPRTIYQAISNAFRLVPRQDATEQARRR